MINENTKATTVRDHVPMDDKVAVRVFKERASGGPKGTRILITDHDSGEVLADVHNKVLITGSQFTACKQWGLDAEVGFTSYNEEFGLENTLDYEATQPINDPIICLFCVGQGGCGSTATDTYPVSYTERISPDEMLPFRYVDEDSDLSDDLRKVYFGRYVDTDGKVRYMFKGFDTEPQIHVRWLDGTQITDDVYDISTDQSAECYVETRLRITRQDFRDYFEQVTGWDSANISSLGLCFAWYDDTIDDYLWYQQILPFSRLNFPVEQLVDLTKAIDFNYQVYY